MFRSFLTALTFSLALAAPTTAQVFGSLWTPPCGQQGEFQEESQHNRMLNMAAASRLVRVGFQIRSGVFDPDDTNVLLECHTNREVLQLADDYGLILDIVSLLHDQGQPNGWNYHNARNGSQGPILDKGLIRDWWISFIGFLEDEFPGLRILGANGKGIGYATIANELSYCPNDCPSPDDLEDAYKEIIDFVMPVWPNAWVKVDGGLLGRLRTSPSWVNSRNIAVSLHCNGDSDSECRNRLEELAQVYNRVFIDEDRHPSQDHNHAPSRYGICSDTPGCIGYLAFYGRSSGNPPETTCCWSVGGCGNQRHWIGVEGCGYAWNDGTGGMFRRFWVGVKRLISKPFRKKVLNERTGNMDRAPFGQAGDFVNYQKFNEAARDAGSVDPNWDFDLLPNSIEDGDPPPPPPPPSIDAPGIHQWCASDMFYHRNILGLPDIPAPRTCKEDPDVIRTYCGWLRFTDANVQCSESIIDEMEVEGLFLDDVESVVEGALQYPPGMHQWCASQMSYHRNILDVPNVPNPQTCKDDPDMVRIYCGFLRFADSNVQCAE